MDFLRKLRIRESNPCTQLMRLGWNLSSRIRESRHPESNRNDALHDGFTVRPISIMVYNGIICRCFDTSHSESRRILVLITTALANTLRYCSVLHSVHKLDDIVSPANSRCGNRTLQYYLERVMT